MTTILAVAEQGLGDAIQMARFLPLLLGTGCTHAALEKSPRGSYCLDCGHGPNAERGLCANGHCSRLIVQCHASLVKLFQRQARERWTVLPMEAEPPEHDLWIGFMSLPAYLGTTLETLPPPADFDVMRYVTRYEIWRRKADGGMEGPEYLAAAPHHIALCTKGGAVASLDKDRSDHTGQLATLTRLDGLEWVDFTSRTGDWLDTAHELATCDLLISVDSALAHLAGSLSVETWLVPPTHFEHRWSPPDVLVKNGVRPDGCFWYPNHTLYWREHTNDWPGATQRIRQDLERRIKASIGPAHGHRTRDPAPRGRLP